MENYFKSKYIKYKLKYLNIFGGDNSYPISKPYKTEFLNVGDNHQMYFEEAGNPDGIPFLNLHGGPGGGLPKIYTKFYNPKKIRIIGIDQRGCGKSTPFGSLENNTTWDIIKDIEKLREHLKIDKWHVVGGSWGSSLTLLYAISHPDRISGMLIHGVCLLTDSETDWLFKEGASNIYPEVWDEFKNFIPENERNDLIKAYYKRLTSSSEEERNNACKIWYKWENNMSALKSKNPSHFHKYDMHKVIPIARIECHYFVNKCFLPNNNYILDNIDKIKDIPLTILQGRYDIVCPMISAYQVHKKLPKSIFKVINYGSHDSFEKPFINIKTRSIDDMVDSSPSF